jgi:hypothetical protein
MYLYKPKDVSLQYYLQQLLSNIFKISAISFLPLRSVAP